MGGGECCKAGFEKYLRLGVQGFGALGLLGFGAWKLQGFGAERWVKALLAAFFSGALGWSV